MATAQFTGASIGSRNLASFEGLRPSPVSVRLPSLTPSASNLTRKTFRGLVVKAETVVAPKVIAVGPGPLDEEGKRKKPLTVSTGNTVLYSKYAGNDFKGSDGDYIVLKASDIIWLFYLSCLHSCAPKLQHDMF